MSWKETFSGRRIDLLYPDPAQIVLPDIAKGLSGTNRFTGHTLHIENVARHSIYVMMLVEELYPDDHLLIALALAHDVHEAYTGDISRPMKLALRELGCEALDLIEALVQGTCLIALGLPPPTEAQKVIIKAADTRMLATERAALMPNTGKNRWEAEAIVPHPKMLELLRDPVLVSSPASWEQTFRMTMELALWRVRDAAKPPW